MTRNTRQAAPFTTFAAAAVRCLQTEARPAPTGSLVIREPRRGLDRDRPGPGERVDRRARRPHRRHRRDVPTAGRAVVIDGRGLTAMPGIVDEHSHIAMGAGSNEGRRRSCRRCASSMR
jgi:hypothetical protein